MTDSLLTRFGRRSPCDPRVIGLRERARAVLAVATMQREHEGVFVDGARALLSSDPGPSGSLARAFELSPDASALLTLVLAPDLAPELGEAFALLSGDPTMRRPSLMLAAALLHESPPTGLAALRELQSNGLADARPRGDQPLLSAPIVTSSGLIGHLLDDPQLPTGCALPADLGIDEEDEALAISVPAAALGKAASAVRETDVLQLCGQDRRTLRELAVLLAREGGWGVVFAAEVPPEAGALRREARLRRSVIAVECQWDGQIPEDAFVSSQPLLQLTTAAAASVAPPGRSLRSVEVGRLDPAEREQVWHAALNGAASAHVETLARRFRLNGWQIRAAARSATERSGHAITGPSIEEVTAAARAQTGAALDRLAPRVETLARWDELVLPTDGRSQLEELVSRVDATAMIAEQWGFGERRRTLPVAALFVGPSGTGKTMAAEALAAHLGLALHTIDLSRVVSKYIGETEQQLDAIFDAAERSNCVLFFDEADALFGKRSEVKDAHDRYANIEVSYLLQRMENHDGVTLLASNLAGNLDEAFTRRLDFTIHFPFPGPEARRLLWARAWPESTPVVVDSRELDWLAERHELSGGSIRNIALAAAFLAARDGLSVELGHVERALLRESRKLGVRIDDLQSLVHA